MQNFKDIILKNLCSTVIFFTYLLVMPSVWMAEGADVVPPQIFIGDTPSAIIVQRGVPVEVPVFFVGGTSTGKEVELYAFRSKDGGYVCLGPDGWESDYATVLEDFKPLLNVPSLPEYFLLQWQAVEDSQSLSDFDLWVCVDEQVEDGIPTIGSLYCGCKSIIVEEVDGDTGDDNDTDTGGGDDTGGGGTQPLIAPPFFDLSGGSGGVCNSLEYTPEGTTFSRSSISESLELGDSEQITLLVSACGSPVTVSSVNKTTGGEWLSASLSGGKVVLNLNTTGLEAGSSNTGTVKVVAGGITDNMYVTLRVLGQCDPTSASVAPTSLTFQAYVGGQNPSETLRVKDNCGDAISATASSNRAWLTVIKTSTGVFSVSCSEQSEGSHSGTITLTDGYDQQHSVSVTLEVTDTPPPPSDDSVETVKSGHLDYYDIGAGKTRYFKFSAGVSDDCQHPIQVGSTPLQNQPLTVRMIIKRGSKPEIKDYNWLKQIGSYTYDCGDKRYYPAKPANSKDYFWRFNPGSNGEFVEIFEPMASNTFYIMLYNSGTSTVKDQRLTVSYFD